MFVVCCNVCFNADEKTKEKTIAFREKHLDPETVATLRKLQKVNEGIEKIQKTPELKKLSELLKEQKKLKKSDNYQRYEKLLSTKSGLLKSHNERKKKILTGAMKRKLHLSLLHTSIPKSNDKVNSLLKKLEAAEEKQEEEEEEVEAQE